MFEVGKAFLCMRPHLTVQCQSQTICVIISHAHLSGAPRRQCVFIFVTLSATTAQHTVSTQYIITDLKLLLICSQWKMISKAQTKG